MLVNRSQPGVSRGVVPADTQPRHANRISIRIAGSIACCQLDPDTTATQKRLGKWAVVS